jgi:hypothetical protein
MDKNPPNPKELKVHLGSHPANWSTGLLQGNVDERQIDRAFL